LLDCLARIDVSKHAIKRLKERTDENDWKCWFKKALDSCSIYDIKNVNNKKILFLRHNTYEIVGNLANNGTKLEVMTVYDFNKNPYMLRTLLQELEGQNEIQCDGEI